jgi:hypothetical protein
MKKRLKWILVFLLLALQTDFAHDPVSNGKATERVVVRFEKFIASGAMLTPQGWSETAKLFDQSIPYPQNGKIRLSSTGGSVGEMWVKEGAAAVQTKWTDDYGEIDSTLRYIPPHLPYVTMTSYQFQLVFTNKHRESGSHGETIKEVTGLWEWKLQGPQKYRWSTVSRAIAYVATKSDESDSQIVKKNAEKTIRILKSLNYGCGSSAC